MGSTRLPGKIAMPILDKPMLWWDIHRVRKSRLLDAIVVATTTESADDQIESLCHEQGWPVFRGSEADVLDRYYHAAIAFEAQHIVRVTSDCPLIDSAVIDYVIAAYAAAAPQVEYASNTHQRSFPRGLDVEIFSINALETAWHEDSSPWREHVTPYIYNHPDRFALLSVTNPVDYSHHRWTVDTPEDIALVRQIYGHISHGDFGWHEVLDVLTNHPEWIEINQHVEQKKI